MKNILYLLAPSIFQLYTGHRHGSKESYNFYEQKITINDCNSNRKYFQNETKENNKNNLYVYKLTIKFCSSFCFSHRIVSTKRIKHEMYMGHGKSISSQ